MPVEMSKIDGVHESGAALVDKASATENEKTILAATAPESALENEKGAVDAGKKDGETEEDESQYPSTKVVAVVMIALYLAMFLVALVSQGRENSCRMPSDQCLRIVRSSQPPSPVLLTSSTLWAMLDGTDQPTCSRLVASNCNLVESTPSITPNGSFYLPSVRSRSALRFAVPQPLQLFSSSAEQSLGPAQPVFSPVSSSS